MPPEDVLEDAPDVLYQLAALMETRHRLLGIHHSCHSDHRAATLRGSGPVCGPVADSEVTCVCSLIGVSIGPGDSHPAAESHTNVLCEADL
jgi:hypothetical protein